MECLLVWELGGESSVARMCVKGSDGGDRLTLLLFIVGEGMGNALRYSFHGVILG